MAKKQKYNITMEDGTKKEVEGEVVNKIWGIDKRMEVTGEQTLKDGRTRTLTSTDYIITHIPTGAALPTCRFRTMKAAKLLLSEPEFYFDELNQQAISDMADAIGRFWNARGWKD